MGKSVYNFVPAPEEKEVFKPNWAEQAQHDMPFSDGETGEIEIKITAQTPIYIRNGHTEQDKKIVDKIREKGGHPKTKKEKEIWKRYNAFSNVDGRYFIPATSLKGMIRNTLEIFSFSRLNPNLVNDDRYSFRDLNNPIYTNSMKSNDVLCGWLTQNKQGKWKIESCGKPIRISHEEIDTLKILKEKLCNILRVETYLNVPKVEYKDDFIYFKSKNKEYKKSTKQYSYNERKKIVSKKNSYTKAFHKYKLLKSKKSDNPFIKVDGKEGYLVFTGQVSLVDYNRVNEKNYTTKYNEFLFPKVKTPKTYEIDKDDDKNKNQKDFRFIYKEGQTDESKDWKYWRKKLQRGKKVPVFFSLDDNGNVSHFGLSYMYKLPYKKSIHEISPIKQYLKSKKYNDLDLATTMFGYTDDKKNQNKALKGRVFFGHSFTTVEPKELELKKLILGSPKASFYPYYLQQINLNKNDKNKVWKYITYDDDAVVRGFKRYPVRKNLKSSEKSNKNSVKTSFIPLNHYTSKKNEKLEFKSKIRFFNLKKVEVGALLSALTFHLKENCYHNLGMAKPFGYGKVKIEVSKLKSVDNKGIEKTITNKGELKEYLKSFEEFMNSEKENWIESSRLKELFAMASNDKDFYNLEYPKLTEFRYIKRDKKFLKEFTAVDKSIKPKSQGNKHNKNSKHTGKKK